MPAVEIAANTDLAAAKSRGTVRSPKAYYRTCYETRLGHADVLDDLARDHPTASAEDLARWLDDELYLADGA